MTFAYPRVSIEFCTQCKWNLRSAWYMQELLSTFGSSLGEVALLPSSAGTFIVTVIPEKDANPIVIWDRKDKGGFPDSKELKQLVRDIIQPNRDLGHVDKHSKNDKPAPTKEQKEEKQHPQEDGDACPNIN